MAVTRHLHPLESKAGRSISFGATVAPFLLMRKFALLCLCIVICQGYVQSKSCQDPGDKSEIAFTALNAKAEMLALKDYFQMDANGTPLTMMFRYENESLSFNAKRIDNLYFKDKFAQFEGQGKGECDYKAVNVLLNVVNTTHCHIAVTYHKNAIHVLVYRHRIKCDAQSIALKSMQTEFMRPASPSEFPIETRGFLDLVQAKSSLALGQQIQDHDRIARAAVQMIDAQARWETALNVFKNKVAYHMMTECLGNTTRRVVLLPLVYQLHWKDVSPIVQARWDAIHFRLNLYFAQHAVYPGVHLVLHRVGSPHTNQDCHNVLSDPHPRTRHAGPSHLLRKFHKCVHTARETPPAHLQILVVTHASSVLALSHQRPTDLLGAFALNQRGTIVLNAHHVKQPNDLGRVLVLPLVREILHTLGAPTHPDAKSIMHPTLMTPSTSPPMAYETQVDLFHMYLKAREMCILQSSYFCRQPNLFPGTLVSKEVKLLDHHFSI